MTSANLAGWSILGLMLIGFFVATAHGIGWWEALLLFVGAACATALIGYAVQLIQ